MAEDKKPRTGTVSWHGVIFRGQEVSALPDGNTMMIALEKHPRVDIGHRFLATPSEVTWDAE
jgi:hypothetical protein